jgi:hypothetical protein
MNPMGRFLCVIAAFCVALGGFLPWTTFVGGTEVNASRLRSQWAFGLGGERTTSVWPESVLFVLLVAAVLILAAAIVGSAAVALVGGVVSGAAVVAWLLQLGDLTSATGSSVWSSVTPAVVAVAAGAALALFSSVALRQRDQQPALMA